MSGEAFVCEARAFGGRHWCGRCQLADADEPACKAPAECGLTLAVLREAALAEADLIDGSIEAAVAMAGRLLAQGAQTAAGPDLRLLRRACALRAMARLVERVSADKTIVERLKGAGR